MKIINDIIRDIDAFDSRCKADERTDTEEVWRLLNSIKMRLEGTQYPWVVSFLLDDVPMTAQVGATGPSDARDTVIEMFKDRVLDFIDVRGAR